MFEILYERGVGQLWYYDEFGNYIESHYSKCGVRQGCVLEAFFFYLVMRLVYARLVALLDHNGAMYAYSDDGCFVSDPDNTYVALVGAPSIYRKVGLRIGWGLSKTELVLSLIATIKPSYNSSTNIQRDSLTSSQASVLALASLVSWPTTLSSSHPHSKALELATIVSWT
jgi:hypothetical protein